MMSRKKIIIKAVPRTAIGVSLLDVISNALASIILLFFIFAALRGQPRPPERQVGMLIIDYTIECIEKPEITIFLQRPPDYNLYLDSLIEKHLSTEQTDTVAGIWDHAVMLDASDGSSTISRRLVYMNPENEGKWITGIIFSDHPRYTYIDYRPYVNLTIKAYFIDPTGVKELELTERQYSIDRQYPTEKIETTFILPRYDK